MSVGIAPAITVEPVREPRSFAPPSLSARFLPLGENSVRIWDSVFCSACSWVGLDGPGVVGAAIHRRALSLGWNCNFCVSIDWMHLPRPRQLEGFRSWEHAPSLAADSDIAVGVENFTGTPIRCTSTTRPRRPFDLRHRLSTYVAAQSTWETNIRSCRACGDVSIGRLFVRYRSWLGLAERWAAAPIAQTVRVLPDLEQARQQALYLIRSKQVEMERRRKRQRGLGREFESLRDYRQGDDFRDISWTATARRHSLVTRVFEIERSQVVWIVWTRAGCCVRKYKSRTTNCGSRSWITL